MIWQKYLNTILILIGLTLEIKIVAFPLITQVQRLPHSHTSCTANKLCNITKILKCKNDNETIVKRQWACFPYLIL